ncbi:MAG: helix-turn-helix domain-containing protein, partial [Acidimicrobiia bacterium]
ALGWSQRRLAEALSCGKKPPVSENTVARWERGERVPPPYLRLALDQLLQEVTT